MLRRDEKKKRGRYSQRSLLLVLAVMVIGCTIPETDPSRYKCDWIEEHVSWECVKDGVPFKCEYTKKKGDEE